MTDRQILEAAHLWAFGFGTDKIASSLCIFEHAVYARLEDIKAFARLIRVRAA